MSLRLWTQHKHVAPCASIIGERVRVMSMGSLACVGGGGGTLRGGEIGEFKYPFIEGEVEEVGDFSFEAMEDEEVAMVDGVF
ncbi:hypothetical protein Tco_1095177 [Tanacetum coccineum]